MMAVNSLLIIFLLYHHPSLGTTPTIFHNHVRRGLDSAAGRFHHSLVYRLYTCVRTRKERRGVNAHIDQQEQQRNHQPDLAPAEVGERAVLVVCDLAKENSLYH